MIRAAVTQAIDYTRADPYDEKWRLKHVLTLREVSRQANAQLLHRIHAHWCAYVGHAQLEKDSWESVKQNAWDTLTELQCNLLSIDHNSKSAEKKDTIENKYSGLIQQYRQLVAEKPQNAAEAEKDKK
jgi:hypothetical protein